MHNRKEFDSMKIIRKHSDLSEKIKKAVECGNFVATPRGPGNCCVNSTVGYCCNQGNPPEGGDD